MKNGDQKANQKTKKKNSYVKWIVQIFMVSIVLSALMTAASDTVMQNSGMLLSIIVILALIGANFVSDLVGMAVMSTEIQPFMAMASKKVRGARHSIFILQNAEKVSNICCDVIGDICGIVSGAAGAAMVLLLAGGGWLSAGVWSIIVSSLISALTIALKGIGKNLAANKGKEIVTAFGYVISFVPIKQGK